MRVLIAFDKFKDALTAGQACDVAAAALRGRHPDWQFDLCPLADGGEGFATILTQAAGGRLTTIQAAGPRGGWVAAPIGLVSLAGIPSAARSLLDLPDSPGDPRIAVIEMAAASGLALLAPELRDPWEATSQGTGQLIRAAAELGAAAVLLGVGGSATHDLGLGALGALGLEFRTADGRKLDPPVPAHWEALARIEGEVFPSIPPIRIACDVSNPLLGPRGAAAVYGPQKGLRPADARRLEEATARVAALLCDHCGQARELVETPGAGAAGGISFGLIAAARARILPGFALVSAWMDLETRLRSADLVLTGEGRFDGSSWEGKGPGAIVTRASALSKPVHVFAGQVDGAETRGGVGHAAAGGGVSLHAITAPGTPLPQALREAAGNLAAAVQRAF